MDTLEGTEGYHGILLQKMGSLEVRAGRKAQLQPLQRSYGGTRTIRKFPANLSATVSYFDD